VQLSASSGFAVQEGDQNQGDSGPNLQVPLSTPPVQTTLQLRPHEEQQTVISNEYPAAAGGLRRDI